VELDRNNPLLPSCTAPLPASVVIPTNGKLLALMSNVPALPTVTPLELEMLPKLDNASVPAVTFVPPE